MLRLAISGLFCLVPALANAGDPARAVPLLWDTDEGCGAPAAVCYDAESESLFVSQISGTGDEKDGVGCISRFDLNGSLQTAAWVCGMNAPKGMALHGRHLWVSDIDTLVQIDIDRAAIRKVVPIAGAKFLTGVACGADGAVYVADLLTSRIHRLQSGKLTTLAQGDNLESPNGLLIQDERLFVAAWGRTTDYTTTTPGRLFSLDLRGGDKRLITPAPLGNLYGLDSDGCDGFLVTDFMDGRLLHIGADGTHRTLSRLSRGAATHQYFPALNMLIVPQTIKNRVSAYDLRGLLADKRRVEPTR